MKTLLTFAFIIFSGQSHAQNKGWEPVEFTVSDEPGKIAIQDLTARNDLALNQIFKTDPTFAQVFPQNLARFATIALQSIAQPWAIDPYRWSVEDEKVSYIFGKTIKNLQIFAMNNAGEVSAPNADLSQVSKMTYRYCENKPDVELCAYSSEYNNVDWAIMRRVLSSAQFVKSACPVMKAYAAWDLQWKLATTADREMVEKFLDETERMLNFIYGDGVWSTSRLDYLKTDFDPQFFRILVRRYLDGGPEFIEEARNCLYEFRNEFDLYEPLPKDKNAATGIEEVLRFKKVQVGGKELELSSALINYQNYYRLTHRWPMRRPLPLDLYIPGQALTYPYDEYLFTLFGAAVTTPNLSRVLWQMSAMDPNYNYRTINKSEFDELFAAGKLPKNYKNVCIIEGSPITKVEKYFEGMPNGKIEEDGWVCEESGTTIVREEE